MCEVPARTCFMTKGLGLRHLQYPLNPQAQDEARTRSRPPHPKEGIDEPPCDFDFFSFYKMAPGGCPSSTLQKPTDLRGFTRFRGFAKQLEVWGLKDVGLGVLNPTFGPEILAAGVAREEGPNRTTPAN